VWIFQAPGGEPPKLILAFLDSYNVRTRCDDLWRGDVFESDRSRHNPASVARALRFRASVMPATPSSRLRQYLVPLSQPFPSLSPRIVQRSRRNRGNYYVEDSNSDCWEYSQRLARGGLRKESPRPSIHCESTKRNRYVIQFQYYSTGGDLKNPFKAAPQVLLTRRTETRLCWSNPRL
jgi:hypothetical protein